MVCSILTDSKKEGFARLSFLGQPQPYSTSERKHAATPPSQRQQPRPQSCRARIHDRQPVEGPRAHGVVFANRKLTRSKSMVCRPRARRGIADPRPSTMQHAKTHKIGRSQDTRDILRTHSDSLHEILRFPSQRREPRSRLPFPRYQLYLDIFYFGTP